jgi:nucleoside-diphosphate-sugar epimerase
MSTAFVTGGSGFIGRNLIPYLIQHGYRVKALARSQTARETVAQLGASPIMGDLDDLKTLQDGMSDCDVVFHSGALVQLWGDYHANYQANVVGTENTLKAAQNAGIKTFVHVGTEAILLGIGEPSIMNANETRPRAVRPLGVYPATKGLAEERVLRANSPTFRTMSMRPRFVWGAGDTSLLKGIMAGVKNGSFRWFDGGQHLTSTCHVTNVCEGLLLGAQKGRGGETYFLTDGTPIVMRDFLVQYLGTQGITINVGSIPTAIAMPLATIVETIWNTLKLKSDPPINRTVVQIFGAECTLDDSKARHELGYVGHISHAQGLQVMRNTLS